MKRLKKMLAISELEKLSSPQRAQINQKFFKTGPGQYGEGDVFIGVTMPDIRKVAKKHVGLAWVDTSKLVRSPVHEHRMLGLLIMVYRYERSSPVEQQQIYDRYVKNFKFVNNWDLVDVTAPGIVGRHLFEGERESLYQWAQSKHLWTRRISVVSLWWMIRKGDLKDIFAISKVLLKDEQDLIHKAVGWMLREAGKKDQKLLEKFLQVHYGQMPRTMLRYAIERLPEKKRQAYLKGLI